MSKDSTELALVQAAEVGLVTNRQAIIAASNPDDMARAQETMIAWCDARIAALRKDVADLEENYQIAKKAKWKASPWKTRANKELRKIGFYEKVKAALQAGYHLIPNFPADIFAIRTTSKPKGSGKTTNSWGSPASDDQKTNSPPMGEGEYVSNRAIDEHWSEQDTNSKGEEITVRHADAVAFDDPLFPFTIVKPEILTDTQKAMALKIFDRVSAVPPRTRRGDPIIIGQVVFRDSAYHEKVVSFLVSWFMDLRQL